MSVLKQSTAITVKLGPFLDDTDGKTAEAGLTLQKADVRVSKNGGNMAAANADQGAADAGAAHDELGYYDISLDATDTNTCGRLKVMVHEAGALPVWAEYQVVEEVVYDALYAVDAAGYGTAQTGDSYAVVAHVTHGNAALKAETALIVEDTGTTLDALVKDIPTTAEFELRSLLAADYFVVTDYTAPPTAGAVADAVWDEAVADHAGVGSTGAALAAAGGSGDPWSTALPGSYADGTAGRIVSDILDLYETTGFDSTVFIADVAAAVLAEIGTGWTESLTEAYPAYGATPTAAQMMWMIYAGHLQRELDGTSLKILQSDGVTAAATYTITLNTQGYPIKVLRTS